MVCAMSSERNPLALLTQSLYGKQPDKDPRMAGGYSPALNFDMPQADTALIGQIVVRAQELARGVAGALQFDHMMAAMDLATCHCNGTPLKLLQLLMCSDDDFTHDFCGIGLHIDRRTGKFFNGFRPRMAV